jgi:hypothetical protein
MSNANWTLDQAIGLPDDLRTWMSEDAVVKLALDAVHAAGSTGSFEPGQPPLPRGRPRVFLTLLTYSYAAGLYGSDEIADRISADPHLCYLAAKTGISGSDLRHFRRYHRAWLQDALATLLALACEAHACRDSGSGYADYDLAASCGKAAERRINEAVLRDTMALDA